MSRFVFVLFSVIGTLSFLFGLIYIIGAIKTKDKMPAYIGVGLICLSIVCVYFLAFK